MCLSLGLKKTTTKQQKTTTNNNKKEPKKRRLCSITLNINAIFQTIDAHKWQQASADIDNFLNLYLQSKENKKFYDVHVFLCLSSYNFKNCGCPLGCEQFHIVLEGKENICYTEHDWFNHIVKFLGNSSDIIILVLPISPVNCYLISYLTNHIDEQKPKKCHKVYRQQTYI